jgi:hypothetical protein
VIDLITNLAPLACYIPLAFLIAPMVFHSIERQ